MLYIFKIISIFFLQIFYSFLISNIYLLYVIFFQNIFSSFFYKIFYNFFNIIYILLYVRFFQNIFSSFFPNYFIIFIYIKYVILNSFIFLSLYFFYWFWLWIVIILCLFFSEFPTQKTTRVYGTFSRTRYGYLLVMSSTYYERSVLKA